MNCEPILGEKRQYVKEKKKNIFKKGKKEKINCIEGRRKKKRLRKDKQNKNNTLKNK